MKIALCFSGFLRAFEETAESWKRYFRHFDDIDVFIHTWNIPDAHLPGERINITRLNEVWRPLNCVVEPILSLSVSDLVKAKNYDPARNPSNVLSMYRKIWLCNTIKSEHERIGGCQYDCVIRARTDIQLKSELKIMELSEGVHIPAGSDFVGINDQLAWGDSTSMDKYSQLWHHLDEYLQTDYAFLNPEILLQHHLDTNSVLITRFPLSYNLLCHGQTLDNEVRSRNFSPEGYLAAIRVGKKYVDGKITYVRNS